MLPKVRAFSKNILIIDGAKGTKKYQYNTKFAVDPDELLKKSAQEISKLAVKGYHKVSDAVHHQIRAYKMRRMMKKMGKSVAHLRAMVHL